MKDALIHIYWIYTYIVSTCYLPQLNVGWESFFSNAYSSRCIPSYLSSCKELYYLFLHFEQVAFLPCSKLKQKPADTFKSNSWWSWSGASTESTCNTPFVSSFIFLLPVLTLGLHFYYLLYVMFISSFILNCSYALSFVCFCNYTLPPIFHYVWDKPTLLSIETCCEIVFCFRF